MQPTKWDSKVKRTRKRLSKREKAALLERYEVQMQQGRNRGKILEEMADEIGVSSQRQAERILAQAAKYQQEIERHRADLSTIALTLASNLESYLDNLGTVFGFKSKIGHAVYGGFANEIASKWYVEMREIDKSVALNLLCHLKEEFPKLANITDWADLTSDEISHDFIARLKLKANRGDFIGKCPACPH